jgi:hypothetical protein
MGGVVKNGSGNLLLGAGSALSVAAFEIIQGETILSAGGQLTVAAGIATNDTGQVCDGHLTIWPGAVLSNQGGTVSCASLTNLGVCECLGGSLIITGNATNGGTLRLLGNAQLHIGGAFSNSGVLDIMTWSGTLPPGFVNHGVLLDRTAIKVESCAVEGGDFEVTIMGYAGHSYQLQCSNGLRPAVWTNVGTAQAGSEAPLVLTHVNGMAVAQRFYRVAVDPLAGISAHAAQDGRHGRVRTQLRFVVRLLVANRSEQIIVLLLVGIRLGFLVRVAPGIGALDNELRAQQVRRAFGALDMFGDRRPTAGDLAALA